MAMMLMRPRRQQSSQRCTFNSIFAASVSNAKSQSRIELCQAKLAAERRHTAGVEVGGGGIWRAGALHPNRNARP